MKKFEGHIQATAFSSLLNSLSVCPLFQRILSSSPTFSLAAQRLGVREDPTILLSLRDLLSVLTKEQQYITEDSLIRISACDSLGNCDNYIPVPQMISSDLSDKSIIVLQIDWGESVCMRDCVCLTSKIPSMIHHIRLYDQVSSVYTNGVFYCSLIKREDKWVVIEERSTSESMRYEDAIDLLTMKNMRPVLIVYNVSDQYRYATPLLSLTNKIEEIAEHVDGLINKKVFTKFDHETKSQIQSNKESILLTNKLNNSETYRKFKGEIAKDTQIESPRAHVPSVPYDSIPLSPRLKRIVKVPKSSTYSERAFPLASPKSLAILDRLKVPSKKKEEGWSCKKCGSLNGLSFVICSSCKVSKFQSTMEETRCPGCFSSNSGPTCWKCGIKSKEIDSLFSWGLNRY